MPLEKICAIACESGYEALCLRASQVGVHSSRDRIETAQRIVNDYGLRVTMVTGDFPIVYNNDEGPLCLRNIGPHLDLAVAFGAPLVRVALKRVEQISWAREAAELAAQRGVGVVHQCHHLSLFETVNSIVRTLEQIDHDHFRLIYEPANLELCGEDYGPETIQALRPWIANVYLQNQRLDPSGRMALDTWSRGKVDFDLIPIFEQGGIDFRRVFAGLRAIDYRGPVTVHQAALEGDSPRETSLRTADYLRTLGL